MTTEERTSKLEGAYAQVNERPGELRNEINAFHCDIKSFHGEMNSRFNQQWAVMGVGWATLMAAVLAVLFTS